MGMGLFMEQRRGKMLLVHGSSVRFPHWRPVSVPTRELDVSFNLLWSLSCWPLSEVRHWIWPKREKEGKRLTKFGEKDFQLGCRRLISSTRFNCVLFMKIGNPSKASRAVLHRACSTCLLGTFSGMWYNWLHAFTLSQMGFWKRL